MSLVAYPCSALRACGRCVGGGISVVTKGDEYVTNALESDASPRVQKCLDRAEYCERAASILTSPNAVSMSYRPLVAGVRWPNSTGSWRQSVKFISFVEAPDTGTATKRAIEELKI